MISKNALVSAIALATATMAGAAMADPIKIYGKVEVRAVSEKSQTEQDADIYVDGLRLGLKQSQMIENLGGVKASWNMEFDLPKNGPSTGSTSSGDVKIRQANVTLASDFGQVKFGRQNLLAVMGYQMDQFKIDSGSESLSPDRVGNSISYTTPAMGPLKAYVQTITDANYLADSTEAEKLDGSLFGASLAGEGYELHTSYYRVKDSLLAGSVEKKVTTVGGSVDLGDFNVFTAYQKDSAATLKDKYIGLGAAYTMNALTLKAGYTKTDNDADVKAGITRLLANYNLGQGLSTFVEYVAYNSDGEAAGGADHLGLGILYKFGAEL